MNIVMFFLTMFRGQGEVVTGHEPLYFTVTITPAITLSARVN